MNKIILLLSFIMVYILLAIILWPRNYTVISVMSSPIFWIPTFLYVIIFIILLMFYKSPCKSGITFSSTGREPCKECNLCSNSQSIGACTKNTDTQCSQYNQLNPATPKYYLWSSSCGTSGNENIGVGTCKLNTFMQHISVRSSKNPTSGATSIDDCGILLSQDNQGFYKSTDTAYTAATADWNEILDLLVSSRDNNWDV